MNKSMKAASIITLLSVMIPVWMILIIETSHVWIMVSPLWLLIVYIIGNAGIERFGQNLNKGSKMVVRIILVVLITFLIYGLLKLF